MFKVQNVFVPFLYLRNIYTYTIIFGFLHMRTLDRTYIYPSCIHVVTVRVDLCLNTLFRSVQLGKMLNSRFS